MFRDPRPFPALPQVTPPKPYKRFSKRQLVFAGLLCLLLVSGVIGGWSAVLRSLAAPDKGTHPGLTFQQFLQGQRNLVPASSALWKPPYGLKVPAVPTTVHPHTSNTTQLPPSAEPVTMQPLTLPLSTGLLTATAQGAPLHLVGSDQRLEVQIAAGSFDLSHALVAGRAVPAGTLRLQLKELHGHFVGETSWLGTYQLQLLDAQGRVLTHVVLRHPITIVYHYQPAELAGLDLDPGRLVMAWARQDVSAGTGPTAAKSIIVALQNDPLRHTLTAQSSVWGVGPLDEGVVSHKIRVHLFPISLRSVAMQGSFPIPIPSRCLLVLRASPLNSLCSIRVLSPMGVTDASLQLEMWAMGGRLILAPFLPTITHLLNHPVALVRFLVFGTLLVASIISAISWFGRTVWVVLIIFLIRSTSRNCILLA